MSKDASRIKLTAQRVESFTCPLGKSQAFLWDTVAPSLLVRVTPTGRKTYAFEGRLNGQTLRIGIGTTSDWTLDKARQRAAELKMLVDSGQDPREIERKQQAEREAQRQQDLAEAARHTVTGLDAWADYIAEGKEVGFTKRGPWGERHYLDHLELSSVGGEPMKRKQGKTAPGPLHALLALPLVQIDDRAIAEWLKAESATRATRAALAFRLLRGFLNWCAGHAVYGAIANAEAHKPKEVRRLVRASAAKDDALQREQLPAWFAAVQKLPSSTIAAYLQCLLLVGCRPGHLLALKWDDINWQWKGLTIGDKVEGERTVPLTPYVAHLLACLPRRNQWVFASDRTDVAITEPNAAHDRACAVAGIENLTLHGLRRSFSSLTEWLEVPAGVVAQIQGHKPSATAEKHYKRRPLDLLRVHHERIEAWILEQAGVKFEAKAEPGKLRVVA